MIKEIDSAIRFNCKSIKTDALLEFLQRNLKKSISLIDNLSVKRIRVYGGTLSWRQCYMCGSDIRLEYFLRVYGTTSTVPKRFANLYAFFPSANVKCGEWKNARSTANQRRSRNSIEFIDRSHFNPFVPSEAHVHTGTANVWNCRKARKRLDKGKWYRTRIFGYSWQFRPICFRKIRN